MSIETVLVDLIDRPLLHARFVNTLSLLEYMGARKILKSQVARDLSMRTLAHAAEEIRHAQILKGFALQLSGGALANYSDAELFCASPARTYFQAVDHACARGLSDQDRVANYALTTLMIEERAMKVYPVYEKLLNERGLGNALKAIIKDEDKHLAETHDEVAELKAIDEVQLRRLRAVEEALFSELVSAFEFELGFRKPTMLAEV